MEKKKHNDEERMFSNKLSEAICLLAQEIKESREQRKIELEWFRSHLQCATKRDLCNMEDRIMSAISEFAAKQKAFNERQGAAVDGLVADVKSLNDKITELQNSAGTVTPEDQALLDEITAQSEALVAKLEALDAQTPPVVPPTT